MSTRASSATRRRRGGQEEEHENSERWLISYSDMITVLMALFIVLFAISQVDQQKYAALKQSLSAGFQNGSEKVSVLDGDTSVQDGLTNQTDVNASKSTASLVTADQGLGSQAASPTPAPISASAQTLAAAQAELAHLKAVEASLQRALAAQGIADSVTFRITSRGLIVGMVANDVFFAAESADLTPAADKLLDSLAPTLKTIDEQISVEGDANVIPTSGNKYETNWELSADRAVKVLRRLAESGGVPETKLQAIGLGDTRPLEPGTDPASLAANRRVDIVIESSASESVRALLPTLAGS